MDIEHSTDLSECMHILTSVSQKFARIEGVPVKDSQAFSDACEAAMEIAQSYDPSKGFGFQKYLASLLKMRMVDKMRARFGRKNSFRRKNQILTTSLDDHVESGGRVVPLRDLIQDERSDDDAHTAEFMDEVLTITENMHDQTFAKCIRCYFLEGKTMAQTGEIVGLSESRVSQMLSRLDVTVLWSRLRSQATV